MWIFRVRFVVVYFLCIPLNHFYFASWHRPVESARVLSTIVNQAWNQVQANYLHIRHDATATDSNIDLLDAITPVAAVELDYGATFERAVVLNAVAQFETIVVRDDCATAVEFEDCARLKSSFEWTEEFDGARAVEIMSAETCSSTSFQRNCY